MLRSGDTREPSAPQIERRVVGGSDPPVAGGSVADGAETGVPDSRAGGTSDTDDRPDSTPRRGSGVDGAPEDGETADTESGPEPANGAAGEPALADFAEPGSNSSPGLQCPRLLRWWRVLLGTWLERPTGACQT